jgi:uncharacterized protein (TIGR00304 family)
MNKYHLLNLICFILGIVFFALGVLYGDVETGFIVVFPFLSGTGIFAFLGFIFIFIAIILFIFGFVKSVESTYLQYEEDEYSPRKKTIIKGGGVVLVGPIPIVFGSNWKIALILMLVAIIIILVSFFLFFKS